MRAIVGAAMLGTVLVAGSLAAQSRGHVQLGGGVSIATGDFKDDGAKTGWVIQVAPGIMAPSGVIGGRVNGTFAKHNFEGTTDNLRILGAMGDLLFAPRMSGKAGVYVLAGVGFQNGKVTGAESETKFAWNAGAGLRLSAGSIGIYVEGRFLSINTEGGKTNTIPITAGVKLGGN